MGHGKQQRRDCKGEKWVNLSFIVRENTGFSSPLIKVQESLFLIKSEIRNNL